MWCWELYWAAWSSFEVSPALNGQVDWMTSTGSFQTKSVWDSVTFVGWLLLLLVVPVSAGLGQPLNYGLKQTGFASAAFLHWEEMEAVNLSWTQEMRCLYLGCCFECWWCPCSTQGAGVTHKVFVSTKASSSKIHRSAVNWDNFQHRTLGFPWPYPELWQRFWNQLFPAFRNEGRWLFILRLWLVHVESFFAQYLKYLIFNLPEPDVSLVWG